MNQREEVIVDEKATTKALALLKVKLAGMKPLDLYDPQDQLLSAVLKGYGYDVETLTKDLKIQRVENSDFISVDYFSESPFLSALTVNALCQEFIRYNKPQKPTVI
jgi:uncharacterized protein involved in exopolysaccharide biosynthesis